MNQWKLFKTKIKELEKKEFSAPKFDESKYSSDDGIADIDVNLTDARLYNPISVGRQRDLDPDIYSYIDSNAYAVPVHIPIRLTLYGVPDEEQDRVKNIVKEHYDFQLRDKRLDLRINRFKALSLFIIGALMLTVYFILAAFKLNVVWYEVLSIVATFIVWEAADFAILNKHDLKVQYYYAAQIALADIVFSQELPAESDGKSDIA